MCPKAPPLAKELLAVDHYWVKENLFSLRGLATGSLSMP